MKHKPVAYQEMSDREFLNGVRRKINTLALTCEEAERRKAFRRQTIRSHCLFLLILLIVSAFLWLIGPQWIDPQGVLYLWAFFMLAMGSGYEYFREERNEYRWRS